MYGDGVARDSTVFCEGWQWLKVVSARGAKDGTEEEHWKSRIWASAVARESSAVWKRVRLCHRNRTGVKVYLQRFALGFLAFASGESLVAFP